MPCDFFHQSGVLVYAIASVPNVCRAQYSFRHPKFRACEQHLSERVLTSETTKAAAEEVPSGSMKENGFACTPYEWTTMSSPELGMRRQLFGYDENVMLVRQHL
jgi:hypothetical protein